MSHERALQDFGSEAVATIERQNVRRSTEINFLKNVERFRLYTAVAAMLNAGMDIDQTVSILSSEYQAHHQRRECSAVRYFLEKLVAARKNALDVSWTTEVEKIMGQGFLYPEEMALLRCMTIADNLAPLFSAAASILSSRSQVS